MPIASFTFCAVDRDVPALNWSGARSEEKPITSVSTATVNAATAGQPFCRVAVDTESYVTFGTEPDATGVPRVFLPPSSVEYFRLRPGDRAAIMASAEALPLTSTLGMPVGMLLLLTKAS